MPRYVSFEADTELNGNTALAFLKNIRHDNIVDILKKHGMDNIDPTAWYPLQSVLNIMNDIYESSDASTNFVSIGIAAAQLGIDNLPPQMANATLEQLLMAYPAVYQQRHRGGDPGEIAVKKVDDSHYIITMRVPYPDDVFYGVMYGYVRHFCPQNKRFSLRYDPDLPRREDGGENTLVHVHLT